MVKRNKDWHAPPDEPIPAPITYVGPLRMRPAPGQTQGGWNDPATGEVRLYDATEHGSCMVLAEHVAGLMALGWSVVD